MAKVNEDLQKERNKCDFHIEELTNFIDGGVHETEKRRRIGKYEFMLPIMLNTKRKTASYACLRFVKGAKSIHVHISLINDFAYQ